MCVFQLIIPIHAKKKDFLQMMVEFMYRHSTHRISELLQDWHFKKLIFNKSGSKYNICKNR